MDTLGIDENNCPVIVEYKRSSNMNVINQGLFYLDWLVTHRGDFEMLVFKEFGKEAAESVEWSAPRLICIAGNFSKYDEHAIKQIDRNIELIRYVKFGSDLLLFEQINAVSVTTSEADTKHDTIVTRTAQKYTTVSQYLEKADDTIRNLFEALREHIQGLGDDVQLKVLRYYFAFKRIKNFGNYSE